MSTDGMTPAVYTIAEACAVARIGRSTLYKHIRVGNLRAIKIGSRTCIPIDEFYRWLKAMPTSFSVLGFVVGKCGRWRFRFRETRSHRSANAPVINSGLARANVTNVQPQGATPNSTEVVRWRKDARGI